MSKIIGQKIKTIWRRFSDKEYRDGFVESHIANNIAFQVYHLREGKGWTQKELAEKAGTLQPVISRLERSVGSTSISTLRKVASALDLAIVVKFVPFSQLLRDAMHENSDSKIPSFSDDRRPSEFQSINIHLTPASSNSFVGEERNFKQTEFRVQTRTNSVDSNSTFTELNNWEPEHAAN